MNEHNAATNRPHTPELKRCPECGETNEVPEFWSKGCEAAWAEKGNPCCDYAFPSDPGDQHEETCENYDV